MNEIFNSIAESIRSVVSNVTEWFSNFIHDNRKRRLSTIILVALIIIAVTTIIIIVSVGNKRRLTCENLRAKVITKADDYAQRKDLYPVLNGDQVTISLRDLDQIVFNDNYVNGTVTFTKYNDTYIKTVNISNAEYCNTKTFGKETDKYNENKNAKVNVTFNYRKVDHYKSKWSSYIPSDGLSTEKTLGVNLPIDSKKLPTIPNNAIITKYDIEEKPYYSYRDMQWKWYKYDIDYSAYSSTQRDGYTKKDEATKRQTEPTEYSIDYPEVKEFRHITTKTGYRWYYMDGKEKVYWENGKYSIESPGEQYEKDKNASAKMYSYYDDEWRWYNGDTKRSYSGYYSTMPKNYNYKDEATFRYTSWTSYKDTSSLTNENKNYREQRTDIHTRFLINYEIHGTEVSQTRVSLNQLESILGQSYEELDENENIKVEVYFTFQYE